MVSGRGVGWVMRRWVKGGMKGGGMVMVRVEGWWWMEGWKCMGRVGKGRMVRRKGRRRMGMVERGWWGK